MSFIVNVETNSLASIEVLLMKGNFPKTCPFRVQMKLMGNEPSDTVQASRIVELSCLVIEVGNGDNSGAFLAKIKPTKESKTKDIKLCIFESFAIHHCE